MASGPSTTKENAPMEPMWMVPPNLDTKEDRLRRRAGFIIAIILSTVAIGYHLKDNPEVHSKLERISDSIRDHIKNLDIGDAFISFR